MSEIIYATDDNLDALITDGAVLVDFFAEWCGPCKVLSPILDQLAEDYAGKVTVIKVDVDACPASAKKHAVRGIPTLIMFNDGQAKGMTVGAKKQSDLVDFVDQYVE